MTTTLTTLRFQDSSLLTSKYPMPSSAHHSRPQLHHDSPDRRHRPSTPDSEHLTCSSSPGTNSESLKTYQSAYRNCTKHTKTQNGSEQSSHDRPTSCTVALRPDGRMHAKRQPAGTFTTIHINTLCQKGALRQVLRCVQPVCIFLTVNNRCQGTPWLSSEKVLSTVVRWQRAAAALLVQHIPYPTAGGMRRRAKIHRSLQLFIATSQPTLQLDQWACNYIKYRFPLAQSHFSSQWKNNRSQL